MQEKVALCLSGEEKENWMYTKTEPPVTLSISILEENKNFIKILDVYILQKGKIEKLKMKEIEKDYYLSNVIDINNSDAVIIIEYEITINGIKEISVYCKIEIHNIAKSFTQFCKENTINI